LEPKYYKKEYNIDNCDSEPLRRILRIQDYGSLVCCDKSFNSWIHYSEDLEVYANRGTVKDYLETYIELDELFDIEDGKILVSKTDADIVLTFHNREESWIIEVESHPDVDDKLIEDRYFNYSLLEVTNCQSVDKFHGIITNEVYHLSGYDHIMVYQFDENMAGQVIAELINAEDRTQFLNLKFPASDIPVQARELYFKEKLRIVSNVDKQHLLIQQDEGISVDLEGICLRGVTEAAVDILC